jgi:DNA-binding response OmpR family regulator
MSSGPGPARVLLVEDDLTLATILAKHLRARGHETVMVDSAEAAADAVLGGFRPTIVLLDINLPGESGWSFLRAGHLEAAGRPRVFILSATAVPASRLHEFGCAGFLPKPFALPTLLDIVERGAGPLRRSDELISPGGLDVL